MSSIAPEIIFIPPVRGVLPNLDPFLIGLDGLRDAENWYFDSNGHFVPRRGLEQLAGTITGERIMAFHQYLHDDGDLRLVAGTNRGWHYYSMGTWIDITGTALTGGNTDRPVFRTFRRGNQIYLLGVNGKDTLKVWDGNASVAYVDAAGSPPVAQCIAISGRHVLLANLKSGDLISPSGFDVSAIQDFDSGWNGTTQRGQVDAEEIVGLLELGNQIVTAFCRNAIGFFIFQAQDSAPFRFEIRVPDTIGPVATGTCVNGKRGIQYFLARDLTVQAFDGTRNESLGPHIQAYLKKHMNENFSHLCHGCFDHSEEKLYYYFVGRDLGLVWRGICVDLKRNNALYPIRFVDSQEITACGVAAPSGNVTRLLSGNSGGKVFQDTGTDDDGAAIPSFFETGLSPWERRYNTVQNILHGFLRTTASQEVTVKIGRTNHAEIRRFGGLTIGDLEGTIGGLEGTIGELGDDDSRLLDLVNAPPYDTGHRTTARSFSLRYEADIAASGVRYRGASLAVQPRGLR